MADWTEFKLTITDPPAASNHYDVIKSNLIPFITEKALTFWVTNYRNPEEDFIILRIKCHIEKSGFVQEFLNTLVDKKVIVNWSSCDWNPANDARNRITNLSRIFDVENGMIVAFDGRFLISESRNFEDRVKQLTALFETLGDCTKAIYTALDSKPTDLWITSLFLHLLLNSMDYGGPDPPSEEANIRMIPPV